MRRSGGWLNEVHRSSATGNASSVVLISQFGATRPAVHEGFAKVKDVSSVIFGKATFDPATRRVAKPRYAHLIVRDGQFVPWDGKTKPA